MGSASSFVRLLTGIGQSLVEARDQRRMRRAVRNLPRRTIAELREGERAVVLATVGLIGEAAPLRAPLSGRPCVYYCVTIEDRGASGGVLRPLADAEELATFELVAGDARALVDPTDAQVATAFDFVSESKAAFDADPAQRALLEAHDLIRRDWFDTTSLRYREAVIVPGNQIVVVGTPTRVAVHHVTGEHGYRHAADTWMRLASTKADQLMISDDPAELG